MSAAALCELTLQRGEMRLLVRLRCLPRAEVIAAGEAERANDSSLSPLSRAVHIHLLLPQEQQAHFHHVLTRTTHLSRITPSRLGLLKAGHQAAKQPGVSDYKTYFNLS